MSNKATNSTFMVYDRGCGFIMEILEFHDNPLGLWGVETYEDRVWIGLDDLEELKAWLQARLDEDPPEEELVNKFRRKE